ncbi:type VII secretion protein EccB [Nocardia asteroides]|uniref:type VII secretion protein EccB n=1 Tax=Nocardia asteroides TaxID=1824 RepID=UPI001E5F5789|nr:type VII secretion protein EccB [Nocardia asteroides]UGT63345.1 type VII secretion protein EccB [Nocardia asteroides]
MARFRVVTKHQISGWRFLLRRIEHALVRRDASMIDDPQRGRSTALSIGVALACVVIAGAAVLSFLKPAKKVADAKIVSEKDSGALFVRIGDRLHPALNLTSARLILGSAEKPVPVTREELAKYPRGPWVGIPGAPGSIADTAERDSSWTVCDTSRSGATAQVDPSTGLPTARLSAPHTTAIGGPLTVDGATTRGLAADEARLFRDDSTTWLVYTDGERGVVRAAIDPANTAVALALGIDAGAPVLAVSKGLIGAIPEAPPLTVPVVPGAGEVVTLNSGLTIPVGSVLTTSAPDQPAAYYLVSRDGMVRVTALLAAVVRNADAQGAASARTVGPDVLAANLRPGTWPGTASYPARPIRLVDPERIGVSCYHWSRTDRDPAAVTELLVGTGLPLSADEQRRTVSLVTAPASGGSTADAAHLPRDTGRFVQVTGADTGSPLRESLYWISDSGVRYGVEAALTGSGTDPTLTALALRTPVPAPWHIVSLFAVGPTLSQRDARVMHDGIPPDQLVAGFGGPS